MSRRPLLPSRGDPRDFRERWRKLAERALAQAAFPDVVTDRDLEDVVAVTCKAQDIWARLANDERGAMCSVFAHAYRAFVRQRRIQARRTMAPLLKLSAELVLQLYAETDEGAAAEAPPARARPFRADIDG